MAYTLREEGYPKESIDSAKHYSELYFKYVQSNAEKDWKQLRAYANTITSRKWVGYLDVPETPKSEGIRWWRSNKYDP
ncbi:hypothetical protein [Dyadobacter fermentans]|uniref:hypothetical protein n=1 Tax=Dyadobacter fermentans TaxID=94254 RepID=UPI0011812E7E|nr:hypothetical protein [Dyadobacter fermentans]